MRKGELGEEHARRNRTPKKRTQKEKEVRSRVGRKERGCGTKCVKNLLPVLVEDKSKAIDEAGEDEPVNILIEGDNYHASKRSELYP